MSKQPPSRTRKWLGFGYIDTPSYEESVIEALKDRGFDQHNADQICTAVLAGLRRAGYKIIDDTEPRP